MSYCETERLAIGYHAPLLRDIALHAERGKILVLIGPNGAGKSALGYALMGHPKYHITGGEIYFQGKEISQEGADKRAKDGLFLSFQSPLEVAGLSLGSFIRNACEQRSSSRIR